MSMQKPMPKEVKKYVQSVICKIENRAPWFCCVSEEKATPEPSVETPAPTEPTSSSGSTRKFIPTHSPIQSHNKVLPKFMPKCEKLPEHKSVSETTLAEEYPWTAVLKYTKGDSNAYHPEKRF